MRSVFAFVLALTCSLNWWIDLSACGDKYLRIGRSMAYGRYAAVYPASILIYGPENSVPARVKDLSAVLKRAGHKPTVVTRRSEMVTTLASGKFDLVLAGLAQSDDVIKIAQSASSHPDVIPVIFEGNKADEAAARAISTCRIALPGAHRNDALAEIDEQMELRKLKRPR